MSASPILFVPGLNCTGEVFAPQIAALGPRYACLVADHTRGRTIGEIAQEVLARAPERFALAGFSLGGYIAFEMLRQAPSRVERLALLSTQATPESDVAREKRLALVALVQEGRFTEAEQAHWPEVVHPSRVGDERLRDIKVRMAEELGPALWLRHVAAIMGRADSRPTLKTVAVPTLVLVGEDDRLTPPERAREMVIAIAQASLVTVPVCGHMAPIERPEAVSAALDAWLGS